MRFGPRSLDEAVGKILAHNLANEDGRRLLRKGTVLDGTDIERIAAIGRDQVYVAELEDDDVAEDQAARRLAEACAGEDLEVTTPSTGRSNLKARSMGLLRVDTEGLDAVNRAAGVTVATLPDISVVPAHQMVATIKIIPYAVPEATVVGIEELLDGAPPILQLHPLPVRKVAMILHGSARVEDRLTKGFVPPLRDRIKSWGSRLDAVDYVVFEVGREVETLVTSLRRAIASGAELILMAGETAIMDTEDIIPTAVRESGGSVESIGAPVDPGNLLMLAYLDGVPVVGAPGCARSRKENVVDWIIPRLLSGEQLVREDLVVLGHGGLLAEIKERPMPREAGASE